MATYQTILVDKEGKELVVNSPVEIFAGQMGTIIGIYPKERVSVQIEGEPEYIDVAPGMINAEWKTVEVQSTRTKAPSACVDTIREFIDYLEGLLVRYKYPDSALMGFQIVNEAGELILTLDAVGVSSGKAIDRENPTEIKPAIILEFRPDKQDMKERLAASLLGSILKQQ